MCFARCKTYFQLLADFAAISPQDGWGDAAADFWYTVRMEAKEWRVRAIVSLGSNIEPRVECPLK